MQFPDCNLWDLKKNSLLVFGKRNAYPPSLSYLVQKHNLHWICLVKLVSAHTMQCERVRRELALQHFRARNVHVINSMIVRIMTCMRPPSRKCLKLTRTNSPTIMKGIPHRDVFVSEHTKRIFGTVTHCRLNVSSINLSLPQRLHFKVSVWVAFACNVTGTVELEWASRKGILFTYHVQLPVSLTEPNQEFLKLVLIMHKGFS